MSFILNRIISKLQKNMENKDLSSTDSKNWGRLSEKSNIPQ